MPSATTRAGATASPPAATLEAGSWCGSSTRTIATCRRAPGALSRHCRRTITARCLRPSCGECWTSSPDRPATTLSASAGVLGVELGVVFDADAVDQVELGFDEIDLVLLAFEHLAEHV